MKKSFGGVPAAAAARPIVKRGFAALLTVFVLAAFVLGGFSAAHAASAPSVPWKDKTVPEQYPEMTFDSKQYKFTTKVDPSEIGESVGSATAFGADDNGMRREKSCSVYSINSLSDDYALAVKYDGQDGYFIFVSKAYRPSTLGDFISDAKLLQNLVFDQKSNKIDYVRSGGKKTTITYRFPKQPDDIKSKISELLSSNAAAEYSIPEDRDENDYMVIFPYLDVIGAGLAEWAVYPDGYIIIKTPECSAGFYIDEEAALAFIDYVQANGVKDGGVNKIALVVAIIALVIFAVIFVTNHAREEARLKSAEEPSR